MTWTHPTAEFESSGSQLKDPDDPWVQRRLRERRIDRAARDVEQAAIELRVPRVCGDVPVGGCSPGRGAGRVDDGGGEVTPERPEPFTLDNALAEAMHCRCWEDGGPCCRCGDDSDGEDGDECP